MAYRNACLIHLMQVKHHPDLLPCYPMLPGAELVISSSWRMFESTREMLAQGLRQHGLSFKRWYGKFGTVSCNICPSIHVHLGTQAAACGIPPLQLFISVSLATVQQLRKRNYVPACSLLYCTIILPPSLSVPERLLRRRICL